MDGDFTTSDEPTAAEPTLPPIPTAFMSTSPRPTLDLFKMQFRAGEQDHNLSSGPALPSSSSAAPHKDDDASIKINPEDAEGTRDIRSFIDHEASEALTTLDDPFQIANFLPVNRISTPNNMSSTCEQKIDAISADEEAMIAGPSEENGESHPILDPTGSARDGTYTGTRGASVSKGTLSTDEIEIHHVPTGEGVETQEDNEERRPGLDPVGIARDGPHTGTRSRTSSPVKSQTKVPDHAEVSKVSSQETAEETQQPVDSQILEHVKVLYSNSVGAGRRTTKKMSELGVIEVDTVEDCNVFVVKNGPLTRSAKLVLSVAMGKPIIFDRWISACIQANELVYWPPFLASDTKLEGRTSFKLSEAIQRGKDGCTPLEGYNILITPTKRSTLGVAAFLDLSRISRQAGAAKIATLNKQKLKVAAERRSAKQLAIFDNSDPDLELGLENGWRCYTSDVIIVSVLRGTLDEESDEFLAENVEGKRRSGRNVNTSSNKKRRTI